MKDSLTGRGPATQLIHAAEGEPPNVAPLTTPIYETTTFVFENAEEVRAYAEGRSRKYLYSRYSNPSVESVERKLALLEKAEAALVFSSGMAATTTALMALLAPGDEIVSSAALYGGTHHLLTRVLEKFGVVARFASLEELADPGHLLSDRTRVFWFESPNNPTLRCIDIEKVASACRARGVTSIIDSTFASPINQNPITAGVDLCMHSATKYLNGHSDVTGGVIAGASPLIDKIERTRRLLGSVLAPGPSYALARGLKTLELRVARHNSNALAVARFLESDRRVLTALYPGLESHPDHAIAKKQMRGFGGMVCVELEGGLEAACRFFDRLQIFKRAASLGGVESLCSLPVLTSHWGYSAEDLSLAGVTAGMARLAVGLEDAQDLIDDLTQALG